MKYIFLIFFSSVSLVFASEKTPLLAGASAVEMNLPQGVPLAGYGGGARRNFNPLQRSKYAHLFKQAQGTKDPIRTKAIVLSQGSTKMAWVSMDLVAVSPVFVKQVTEKLASLGFSKDGIFISATHTHSGPGAFADNKFWALVAVDKFNQEIFNLMVDSIIQAVSQANAALAPALIGSTEVRIDGVTNNRRKVPFLDPVGTLLRIDKTDGSPIATFFNFPIHGTVQGMSNLYLSGDVPSAIERHLGSLTGGVTLFVNGAAGDVSPFGGEGNYDSWQRAQVIGQNIGDHAFQAWQTTVPHTSAGIKLASYQLNLPGARLNITNCLKKNKAITVSVEKYFPRSAPFHGVIIDDTVFATLPGEVITELGMNIKDFGHKLGFGKVAVVGLTNEYLGYFLTAEEYGKGGEEGCGSMYGKDMGQWVVESAEKVLTDLSH